MPEAASARFEVLQGVGERLRDAAVRLRRIISQHEQRGDYTVDDVVLGFRGSPQSDDLLSYSEKAGACLRASGRERTARAYRSAVVSLLGFNSGKALRLTDIDAKLINGWEKELLCRGLSLNTVSFYMRNLRALYYRAVKDRLIAGQYENPFAQVYTGIAPTRKRALTRGELAQLVRLDDSLGGFGTSGQPQQGATGRKHPGSSDTLREALLYFLFCYHARGMSYVDMAYLKKSQIKENKLVYLRRKTGRQLTVKVTAPMRKILGYFSRRTAASSPYVFPVIDPVKGGERRQYESGLRMQNARLWRLSAMVGLDKRVTTHVSRHSWATIAKREMVDIALISEALGHNNIKTTGTYLDSFESSRMDRLSDRMSGLVKKTA